MKLLFLVFAGIVGGCATSRTIATIKHADGSGVTTYKYIAAGGIIRPGVIVLVQETVGNNAPVVLTQASGSALAPSVISASGIVGAAATLGATLRPDKSQNTSTTTLNQVEPPGAPRPTLPPSSPSRPPFGPPPWHSSNPHNKGR